MRDYRYKKALDVDDLEHANEDVGLVEGKHRHENRVDVELVDLKGS